jgi:polysaccharide export outer membrane protein
MMAERSRQRAAPGCACPKRSIESSEAMRRILNVLSHNLSVVVLAFAVMLPASSAQNAAPSQDTQKPPATDGQNTAPPTEPAAKPAKPQNAAQANSASLTLGPGDEVEVAVYGAPDLSAHTRVTSDGNVSLPLVGYVRVSGLTSSEAEAAIENQLRQTNVVNDPHVSVFVREFASSGVTVVGEVGKPGAYTTLGPHRLFDIIQSAGGLTEKAANRAVITHRGSDTASTFELSKDPAQMAQSNVEVQPGDTIVVPIAPIVYVLGEVGKPGGYALGSGINGVTILRVVAAAGGPTRDASVGKTKMLRKTPNGLEQIPVPLKKILSAKAPDVPLEPDDIIFVPNSKVKEILNGGALITTLGASALYRIP